jgi:hypothetical protein
MTEMDMPLDAKVSKLFSRVPRGAGLTMSLWVTEGTWMGLGGKGAATLLAAAGAVYSLAWRAMGSA